MKVAIIGNMNNNAFSIARHLRARGHDAHFFVYENEEKHFHPSLDTFSNTYKEFMHKLPFKNTVSSYYTTFRSDIKKVLHHEEYDMIAGCGNAPAILMKHGIPLHLFIPYGSDIYSLAYYPFRITRPRSALTAWFSNAQRKGIRRCLALQCPPTNEIFESYVQRLGYTGLMLRSFFPAVFPEAYIGISDVDLIKFPTYATMQDVRRSSGLVVMHHARHVWTTTESDIDIKRNDILIRAFARVCARLPDLNPKLVMFEYGSDVEASKSLVSQLGIESNTIWFPCSPRKEIMVALRFCDIVATEFHRSWLMSGVVFEALCASKPVLCNRDDSLYAGMFEKLYPCASGTNEDELADALVDAGLNPDKYRAMGLEGRRWYDEFVVERAMRDYETIGAMAASRR